MAINNIAILGLGLIGGSLAKTLKKVNPQIQISALDHTEVLQKAKRDEVIDIQLNDWNEALQCEVIFLCFPVDDSLKLFEKISPLLSENQIITDVCSIKAPFESVWMKSGSKGIYIGGHPMTGKEKSGYDNCDSLLFENCTYILNDNAREYKSLHDFTDLIHMLGAKITFLNAKVHDIIVASVSHLPQLLSVSLINSASLKDSDLNFLDYAGGGFRDMTRIAASDYNIWESIIRKNSTNIVQAIDNFIIELEKMKMAVINGDHLKLASKFESARVKRDEIPKSSKGFMHQLYDVFVYVKDQPGEISKISTALFQNNINIKDIEVLKIREGTGGTFRLAFDNEPDAKRAKQIVEEIGFSTKI